MSLGGNAADAAVAMGLTMAVTLPSRVGVTGGGLCAVFDPDAGTVRTLDFLPRGAAGSQTAVPALLRGLYALHASQGALRWERLVAAPEGAAGFGTRISRVLARDIAAHAIMLSGDPGMARTFLDPAGRPLEEGAQLVRPELAAVLAAVRQQGVGAFYAGRMSAALGDGLGLDPEAIRNYQPTWRDGSGVSVGRDSLHFARADDSGSSADARAWGIAAEAAGRNAPSADRRYEAVVGAVRAALGDRVPPAAPVAGLVVVDPDSRAVACALTLGGPFGAGRMVPGLGTPAARPTDGSGIGGPVLLVNENIGDVLFAAVGGSDGGPDGAVEAKAALISTALETRIHGTPVRDAVALAPAGGTVAVDCAVDRDNSLRACVAATDPRGAGLAVSVEK